jgi:hypothetical protein
MNRIYTQTLSDYIESNKVGLTNTHCDPSFFVSKHTQHSSPMTDEEEEEYVVEGGDPCIPTLRVWLDQEQNLPSSQSPNIQQLIPFE